MKDSIYVSLSRYQEIWDHVDKDKRCSKCIYKPHTKMCRDSFCENGLYVKFSDYKKRVR